jgi:uncharacterized coiled-coil protein SlyX
MAGGLGVFLIVLSVWSNPARADNVKGPTLAQLAQELAGLKARVTTLEGTVSSLETTVSAQASQIGSLQAAVASLQTVQSDHQNKLQYVTVAGTDMIITGANLHVRNGLGTTEMSNGLGNLIVGYNENPNGATRTGSHNVVVGPRHWYSSYGGLVVGWANAIDAPYASVSGGTENRATGYGSSVSGGSQNNAVWILASVSGGENNTASGRLSSISGGSFNNATADVASVSGGFQNTASGSAASVSGGSQITQALSVGWSGGTFHTP